MRDNNTAQDASNRSSGSRRTVVKNKAPLALTFGWQGLVFAIDNNTPVIKGREGLLDEPDLEQRFERDNNVAGLEDSGLNKHGLTGRSPLAVAWGVTGTAKAITARYRLYLATGNMEPLLLEIHEYVSKKLYTEIEHYNAGFKKGTAQNADDWAQHLLISVWEALSQGFRVEDPKQFYSWLKTVSNRKVADAKEYVIKERNRFVPFHVERENDDGELEEIENPLVYSTTATTATEYDRLYQYPVGVQGLDLQICRFIYADYKYAQIAEMLGMTEKAIRERVFKMRERQKAERAAMARRQVRLQQEYRRAASYRTNRYRVYTETCYAKIDARTDRQTERFLEATADLAAD